MSLPKPIEKRRGVLVLRFKGHFVVLGTTGSRKRTLAILCFSILLGRLLFLNVVYELLKQDQGSELVLAARG